jgi:hypothetical protein
MSFSHLEKALILLRDRGQWSRAVAAAVQARYDRHDRPDIALQAPEPPRDLRNFVFLADFAPGYTNTTAFVSYFKLTDTGIGWYDFDEHLRERMLREAHPAKTVAVEWVAPDSTVTRYEFTRERKRLLGPDLLKISVTRRAGTADARTTRGTMCRELGCISLRIRTTN